MFKGFNRKAIEFMAELNAHNDKEWFEPRKQIYLDELYQPMKQLCDETAKPFLKIDGMMCKTGRIYSDPNYPPYRKYRENMWFIVKHEAWDWSKTPSLFFELSADGAVFGFKITHPSAPVMEKFRRQLVSDEALLKQIKSAERMGMALGGDDYKRPKPCDDSKLERFFLKKSLKLTVTLSADDEALYSPELPEMIIKAFKKLLPINELFEEFVREADAEKLAAKQAALEEMPKAPSEDFMW